MLRILDLFKTAGMVVSSEQVVPSYLTDDFEKWTQDLMGRTEQPSTFNGTLYTEKNFWPVFLNDLKSAKSSVIVVSPFISLARASRLMDLFRYLLEKGVDIRVYARPPTVQRGHMSEHAQQVVTQLRNIGARVTLKQKLHQKVAVIDRRISWEGSLNILSHRDSEEQMRRIEGQKAATEIVHNLELDQDAAAGNLTDELCPLCLKKGLESPLVIRQSKYGRFKACSSWPKTGCPYKENLSKGKQRKRQS